MTRPLTPSERVTRSRRRAVESGAHRLSAILRDPAAIAELQRLIELHGSERAALESLLTGRADHR